MSIIIDTEFIAIIDFYAIFGRGRGYYFILGRDFKGKFGGGVGFFRISVILESFFNVA